MGSPRATLVVRVRLRLRRRLRFRVIGKPRLHMYRCMPYTPPHLGSGLEVSLDLVPISSVSRISCSSCRSDCWAARTTIRVSLMLRVNVRLRLRLPSMRVKLNCAA